MLFFLFLVSIHFDYVSTLYALSNGSSELNPFVNYFIENGYFYLYRCVFSSIFVYILSYLVFPQYKKFILIFLILVGFLVSFSNFSGLI